MKKYFIILYMYAFPVLSYCVPDNETCFDCGTNCIAELTFENVVQEDGTNKNVGTFTVYGTGENGTGEMGAYSHIYNPSNPIAGDRITKAPWEDKILEINNIVITEGISNVGQSAFTGAKNLDHLDLPESVHTIADGAFLDSSLKSINTLQNVTTIGDGAFERTRLTSIDLSDHLQKIDDWAFAIIPTLKEIIIPDSVTAIDTSAFHNFPSDGKIYCNNINNRCDQLFEGNTGAKPENIVKYTKDGDVFFLNGKWYQTPNDVLTGEHIKKRIYTIDEANRVSSQKNKFIIRYK